MALIQSPSTGRRAEVSFDNRLKTRAITESDEAHASETLTLYNFNSGSITLTSANPSAVLFLMNNSTVNYLAKVQGVVIDTPIGPGTGSVLVEFFRNPGSISSGSIVETPNMNFGSLKAPVVSAQLGGEGTTFDNGQIFFSGYVPTGRTVTGTVPITLPPGSSLGMQITPPPGNTFLRVTPFVRFFDLLEE